MVCVFTLMALNLYFFISNLGCDALTSFFDCLGTQSKKRAHMSFTFVLIRSQIKLGCPSHTWISFFFMILLMNWGLPFFLSAANPHRPVYLMGSPVLRAWPRFSVFQICEGILQGHDELCMDILKGKALCFLSVLD